MLLTLPWIPLQSWWAFCIPLLPDISLASLRGNTSESTQNPFESIPCEMPRWRKGNSKRCPFFFKITFAWNIACLRNTQKSDLLCWLAYLQQSQGHLKNNTHSLRKIKQVALYWAQKIYNNKNKNTKKNHRKKQKESKKERRKNTAGFFLLYGGFKHTVLLTIKEVWSEMSPNPVINVTSTRRKCNKWRFLTWQRKRSMMQ